MNEIERKLTEGRQYRDMQPLTPTEEMRVDGYATTFGQPYVLWSEDGYTVREQIDPHAFDETDLSDVIMQYNHEGRVFARTGNGTLKLTPDEHGLRVQADLGGTEIGRQLYEEIKGGYTNKMSFGFRVGDDKREVVEEGEKVDILRTILKVEKLYDVSAVALPANDATNISARTYGEGVIAEVGKEIAEREQRKRQIKRIRILTEVTK